MDLYWNIKNFPLLTFRSNLWGKKFISIKSVNEINVIESFSKKQATEEKSCFKENII